MTTTLTYDNAGRKLTMSDPDMGSWEYAYDALGNLTSQTDARACVLMLGYDLLNRLTTKSSSGACGLQVSTAYTYDAGVNGIGRRTGMTDASGSSTWTYDARGRMIAESKTITGGGDFLTEWAYNSADLPTAITYPGGEQVNYTYDARMLPYSAIGTSNYVTSAAYDSAGRATSRALGNGLATTYAYYAWNAQVGNVGQGGRLQSIETGARQDLSYTYDKMGNLTQLVDGLAAETSTHTYDGLNRLTSWTLNVDPPERYTYDVASGNLASKAGASYTYDANHAHAVAARSDGSSYQYDANGNMTVRVVNGQTFNVGYDAENRLVSVTGAVTASFAYDGDGKRVKSTIDGTTTYFVGNIYESTGGIATKYYYAGSQRIAMRVGTADPCYLLSDHLGSTTVITDGSGNLVTELRYEPWGEVRSGSAPTDYTFTGQYSNVSDFGLMFYNARWMDPSLGRFASADSIVPNPGDSQSWDRYAYGLNNPVRYTDPSGNTVECGAYAGSVCGEGPPMPTLVFDRNGITAAGVHGGTPEQYVNGLNTTWGYVTIPASIVFEPVDWAVTLHDCLEGHCSLWMLAGLLPLVPASAGKYLGEVAAEAGKSGDSLVQLVPASTVHWSQSTVSAATRAGVPLDDLAQDMAHGWSHDPLRVVEIDGELVSLDNRRLTAAKLLGIDVPVRISFGQSLRGLRTLFRRDGIFSAITIRGNTGISLGMGGELIP